MSQPKIVTLFDRTISPEFAGQFYPGRDYAIIRKNLVLSQSIASVQQNSGASVIQSLQPGRKVDDVVSKSQASFSKSSDWVRKNYFNPQKKGKITLGRVFVMLFLAVSMYGFAILAMPILVAEASFRISQYTSTPKTMSGTASASIKAKALDPDIAQEFRIVIPKINLESRVVENVDPTNEVAYKDALTKGIAHAQGSYLPGQGTVFMFAHSTNDISNILAYNAKFYAVKDLQAGDQVAIFYHGKKYTYQIESQQIINPSDLDVIRNSNADLILSTCYPPGTDWQRLITFAKLVDVK